MNIQIINDASLKIISEYQLNNEGEEVQLWGQKMLAKDVKPLFFQQYRCNVNMQLKRQLENSCKLTTKITMPNFCNCLLSLKFSFDSNLMSHVVYELICCGCSSAHVGQTCRHLAKRTSQHQKTDSPQRQHVVD